MTTATARTIAAALSCTRSGCECSKLPRGGSAKLTWRTHCPAHLPDTHPALDVTDTDGKLLVYCHVGCSQDAVIAALKARELWPTTERSQRPIHESRSAAATIKYPALHAETGKIVAYHWRNGTGSGKRVWWEQPNGTKKLPDGVGTPDLALFGMADAASQPRVVVGEGEKVAQHLSDAGIPAVGTVTGAAGTPGDAALRPLLAVPTVVLWPDADEVGAAHMCRVAVRLAAMGHQDVRQVQWADAQEHDDAADALARGVDVLQLIEAAGAADTGIPNGGKLLDALVSYFRRYIVMSLVQATAFALWVLHTHAFGAADRTPYINVSSAEKRSGKTLLLEAAELVVRNSWRASRATPAALYRKIDASAPTVLLDEMDAMFKGDKEMAQAVRGILNAGYQRGGVVSVVAGQGTDTHVVDLNAFAPKALAGIGDLPETVMDRSIVIRLSRRRADEPIDRFRSRQVKAIAAPLRDASERWAAAFEPQLRDREPDLPEALDDRAGDSWEPLLAIADLVGGEWPERARKAALALSAGDARGAEDDTLGVRLLYDLRGVVGDLHAISSADVIRGLNALEEAPWGDLNGKPLDQRRLARLLKPYGIKSGTVTLGPGDTPKGFYATALHDAFTRYLPPPTDDGLPAASAVEGDEAAESKSASAAEGGLAADSDAPFTTPPSPAADAAGKSDGEASQPRPTKPDSFSADQATAMPPQDAHATDAVDEGMLQEAAAGSVQSDQRRV